MMITTSRCLLVISVFVSLSCSINADRRTGNRRRQVRGSIAYPDGNHRRTAHWGGAIQVDSVPPHVTARTNAGNDGSKNQPKNEKGYTKRVGDDFSVSNTREIDADDIEEVEPKKGKSKKTKKNGSSSTATECDDPNDLECIDCDDADDPLCQSQASESSPSGSVPVDATTPAPSAAIVDTGRSSTNSQATTTVNKRGNGRKYGFASQWKNTTSTPSPTLGATTSAPRSTATMHRSLTPFKLGFSLTSMLYEDDLDDGDYAELSDHTELFLTQYFMSYFAEEPTEFHDTTVAAQKTDNPLIVRLYITVTFVVPGNVPTMSNLFDRMQDAFSGQRATEYIALLNDMGLGNPFRNAVSVVLVHDVPANMKDPQSDENDGSSFKDNTAQFLSVVIGSSVLVLVTLGLIWACRQSRRSRDEPINQMSLDDVEQQDLDDLKRQAFNNPKSRGANEANTRAYIQTIRNRYSDDGASKTDREDVSLDGDDDEDDNEHTEATGNRQRLAELREAMHLLDSFSASGIEKSEQNYPSPPSDGNISDEDTGRVSNDKNEQNTGATGNVQSKNEYMDYLDFQSSYDEEEDLRT